MYLYVKMQESYVQRLALNGHRILITYSFRELWHRRLNGHLQPPVVIRLYPNNINDTQELTELFSIWSDDLIFIIREYLSTVKARFRGITFQYELVNHAIKMEEDRQNIEYYRAELKWVYND